MPCFVLCVFYSLEHEIGVGILSHSFSSRPLPISYLLPVAGNDGSTRLTACHTVTDRLLTIIPEMSDQPVGVGFAR